MKCIFFVPVILATSFSHGMEKGKMEKDVPLKRSLSLLLSEQTGQSFDQKNQLKRSPRVSLSDEKGELKPSPRRSFSESMQQLSGQSTVSSPIAMPSTSPKRERTQSGGSPIVRVRTQSDVSPRFVKEENMHRFLEEQQLKKEAK